MTIADLFEAMPARLDTAAAAKVNKTVQWNITGEDPGVWAVQINDGAARLVPGVLKIPMSPLRSTVATGLLLQKANSVP